MHTQRACKYEAMISGCTVNGKLPREQRVLPASTTGAQFNYWAGFMDYGDMDTHSGHALNYQTHLSTCRTGLPQILEEIRTGGAQGGREEFIRPKCWMALCNARATPRHDRSLRSNKRFWRISLVLPIPFGHPGVLSLCLRFPPNVLGGVGWEVYRMVVEKII